jgi:hypothetical protein
MDRPYLRAVRADHPRRGRSHADVYIHVHTCVWATACTRVIHRFYPVLRTALLHYEYIPPTPPARALRHVPSQPQAGSPGQPPVKIRQSQAPRPLNVLHRKGNEKKTNTNIQLHNTSEFSGSRTYTSRVHLRVLVVCTTELGKSVLYICAVRTRLCPNKRQTKKTQTYPCTCTYVRTRVRSRVLGVPGSKSR